MGLPGWIVELRHDATHNQMPSLSVLRTAATTLVNWYFDFYWQPQMALLQSLTTSCLPALPNSIMNTNSNSKFKSAPVVAVEVAESTHQQDSSPTFVTEIFLPIFLGGAIQSAPEVAPSTEGSSLAALLVEEMNRQRKFWSSRIKDLLKYNSYAAYSLLYGLLGAAKDTAEKSRRHDIETWRAEWELDMVLLWVAELTSGLTPGRAGAVASNNVGYGTTLAVAHLSTGFLQTLLFALQDRVANAKMNISSKLEQLVSTVSAFYAVDLRRPKVVPPSTKKNYSALEKKRKMVSEVDLSASSGERTEDIQSENSSKSVSVEQKSITRLDNYPIWPLGCVPGSMSTGLLHCIEEII